MPSIRVALTWLNSSSGVSLVMSLIPKTNHAPFTASHTKLNAKLKNTTAREEKCQEKKKGSRKHSDPKGVWSYSQVTPQSCPMVAQIFDVRRTQKNTATQKAKKKHLGPKAPADVVQLFHLQLSRLKSRKTTE